MPERARRAPGSERGRRTMRGRLPGLYGAEAGGAPIIFQFNLAANLLRDVVYAKLSRNDMITSM